ncbi:MAG TPA: methylated-DNA--[protein]-cysteine S-methyltransferase [Chloroflexota bacterium]|nr:methylated-DNA--[protein]-cysteine S-methyltransferase [Chloroflexota bacterium]
MLELAAITSLSSRAPAAVAPPGRPPSDPPGMVWYTRWDAPIGPVWLAATARGVCAVGIGESEAAFGAWLARAGWTPVPDAAPLAPAVEELSEYFTGRRRQFSVPLDLVGGTAFDRRVWAAIAAIPYGETRTYSELAVAVGCPGGARAVGRACGRNPLPLFIPCHRVVRGDGALGGYGGGVAVKAALLALERRGAVC